MEIILKILSIDSQKVPFSNSVVCGIRGPPGYEFLGEIVRIVFIKRINIINVVIKIQAVKYFIRRFLANNMALAK